MRLRQIGKSNPEAVEASVAYKALVRIGAIYDLEGALKNLSAEERLKERQSSIKPLVEEFFSWLRKIQADRSVLPKSETAKGINYCLNQEEYSGKVRYSKEALKAALIWEICSIRIWPCAIFLPDICF
mgnify:CR=1 FL=1